MFYKWNYDAKEEKAEKEKALLICLVFGAFLPSSSEVSLGKALY